MGYGREDDRADFDLPMSPYKAPMPNNSVGEGKGSPDDFSPIKPAFPQCAQCTSRTASLLLRSGRPEYYSSSQT